VAHTFGVFVNTYVCIFDSIFAVVALRSLGVFSVVNNFALCDMLQKSIKL